MKCCCTADGEDPCADSELYSWIDIKKLDSWCELTEEYDALTRKDNTQWVFRGHKCCSWGLKTELERCFEKFGVRDKDRPKIEGGVVRLFKRELQRFRTSVPAEQDYMEWLALMRHHGAPTRLLDCTYSFFVALFFAVEEAKTESALWAIDTKWVENQFERKHRKAWKHVGTDGDDPNARCFKTFKEIFLAKKPFVINMNSYNQNERQVIQQGTFLCPGNIECSFEENLKALADRKSLRGHVIKFVITANAEKRNEILKRLHRMNMNRATLFPGLDGFAQSLKTRLLFRQLLVPDPDWGKWIKTRR